MALALSPGARGPEILLIRRARREGDPWSGHIGLPGGRREAVDADLLATAVRETREEVGVHLSGAALLGELDDLRPSAPGPEPLLIRPFVFGLEERPAARLSDEVAGLLWAGLGELPSLSRRARVSMPAGEREVDAFVLGDATIWGLTYRILSSILPLL